MERPEETLLQAPIGTEMAKQSHCGCSDSGYYNVILMSVGFMILFSSYNTLQNYVTSLLGVLGNESLTVLYAAVVVCLFFAPFIIEKLSEKWAMVLGGFCYVVYMASLLKIVPAVVLIAAFICGFGAAVLWVAQGSFLTKISTPRTIGNYTGLFWTIFQLSNVFGNLFAFFVFPHASETVLFYCFVIGGVIGSSLLIGLKPAPVQQAVEQTRKTGLELLMEMKGLLRSKKLWSMAPLFFWTGFELGFWSGVFPTLLRPESIGLVLAFAGIAEVLGGLSLGNLSDHFGSTAVLTIGFLSYAFALILSILFANNTPGFNAPTWSNAPWSAFLAAFCFGLGDCVFNTQAYILTGSFWRDNSVGAFTYFQILQGLGSALGFYLPVLLPLQKSMWQFYIQASVLTIATAGATCAYIFNTDKAASDPFVINH